LAHHQSLGSDIRYLEFQSELLDIFLPEQHTMVEWEKNATEMRSFDN
jgi:hypothetical protein